MGFAWIVHLKFDVYVAFQLLNCVEPVSKLLLLPLEYDKNYFAK